MKVNELKRSILLNKELEHRMQICIIMELLEHSEIKKVKDTLIAMKKGLSLIDEVILKFMDKDLQDEQVGNIYNESAILFTQLTDLHDYITNTN